MLSDKSATESDKVEKTAIKPFAVKRVQTAEGWKRSVMKNRKKSTDSAVR